MSATGQVASTMSRTAGADLRRVERVIAAVLMPIGPAAIAAVRVLYTDPSAPAADPTTRSLVLWLGVVGLFTLLPGAYAALKLLRRSTPRLAAWTAVFLIPGYLAMPALVALDAYPAVAPGLGLDPATNERVLDALMGLPQLSVLVGVFVVGHVVGTVLLGVSMIVGRAAPLVIAILTAISQPMHFTEVMVGNPTMDLVAWGLTAVGMGFLARRVLLTSNDEWELPPRPACRTSM